MACTNKFADSVNGITVVNPLVFTPRVQRLIWACLDRYGLFSNNPNAPSAAAFLAHYAASSPKPVFSWTDAANRVVYSYDLSINQVEVMPAPEPYSVWVNEGNRALWEIVPADLLDLKEDWKKAWFKAAKKLDVASLWFIIEQGFEVNARDDDGFTALFYVAGCYGGSLEIVRLLVESGADLTFPGNTTSVLIEVARTSATSSAEAHEARLIAAYLQTVDNID